MRRTGVRHGVAAIALLLIAGTAHLVAKGKGHDWPQFRGLERDGASAEKGLAQSWPDGGPKELFRVPLGEGYSGISIVGDRLYTGLAADHDGEPMELLVAHEAASGKEVWRTPIGKKFDNEFGNGPRATPTVTGGTVYMLGSVGDLVAVSAEDGAIKWKKSLVDDFGSQVPTFGFSTSPLVDDGQVVVEVGGGENKLYAALDAKTGEPKWWIGNGGPGYNSPLEVDMPGGTRYVWVSGGQLMGVTQAGEEVFSFDWPRGETHAIPVVVPPNRIFASGAEPVGGLFFEVDKGGSTTALSELWKSNTLRVHFNAGVHHDGHVYLFDNATLKCIDAKDSKMAWGKRGLGKGSMIYADGQLYVLSDSGTLLLVEASPEGYKENGRIQAFETSRCWTAPSLSDGKLYLRNHLEMVAYDVTK